MRLMTRNFFNGIKILIFLSLGIFLVYNADVHFAMTPWQRYGLGGTLIAYAIFKIYWNFVRQVRNDE